MSVVSSVSVFSNNSQAWGINARIASIMDSIVAIAYGVAIRFVVDFASHQNQKITGTLVGLWEGIVLQHFLRKMPQSFDPFIAYGVRLFIDFLVTENVPRLVLVIVWTGVGAVLADVAPDLWVDVGLHRYWNRFRRDMYIIYRSFPSFGRFTRARTVRFSPSQSPSRTTHTLRSTYSAASTATAVTPNTRILPPLPSPIRKRSLPGTFPGYASETETERGSVFQSSRRPPSDTSSAPGPSRFRFTIFPEQQQQRSQERSNSDDTTSISSSVLYDLDDGNVSSSSSSTATGTTETADPSAENPSDIPDEEDEVRSSRVRRRVDSNKGKRPAESNEPTPKQVPIFLPPTPSESARDLEKERVIVPRVSQMPLIPDGDLADGWETVEKSEAAGVPPPVPQKDRPSSSSATSTKDIPEASTSSQQQQPKSQSWLFRRKSGGGGDASSRKSARSDVSASSSRVPRNSNASIPTPPLPVHLPQQQQQQQQQPLQTHAEELEDLSDALSVPPPFLDNDEPVRMLPPPTLDENQRERMAADEAIQPREHSPTVDDSIGGEKSTKAVSAKAASTRAPSPSRSVAVTAAAAPVEKSVKALSTRAPSPSRSAAAPPKSTKAPSTRAASPSRSVAPPPKSTKALSTTRDVSPSRSVAAPPKSAKAPSTRAPSPSRSVTATVPRLSPSRNAGLSLMDTGPWTGGEPVVTGESGGDALAAAAGGGGNLISPISLNDEAVDNSPSDGKKPNGDSQNNSEGKRESEGEEKVKEEEKEGNGMKDTTSEADSLSTEPPGDRLAYVLELRATSVAIEESIAELNRQRTAALADGGPEGQALALKREEQILNKHREMAKVQKKTDKLYAGFDFFDEPPVEIELSQALLAPKSIKEFLELALVRRLAPGSTNATILVLTGKGLTGKKQKPIVQTVLDDHKLPYKADPNNGRKITVTLPIS